MFIGKDFDLATSERVPAFMYLPVSVYQRFQQAAQQAVINVKRATEKATSHSALYSQQHQKPRPFIPQFQMAQQQQGAFLNISDDERTAIRERQIIEQQKIMAMNIAAENKPALIAA